MTYVHLMIRSTNMILINDRLSSTMITKKSAMILIIRYESRTISALLDTLLNDVCGLNNTLKYSIFEVNFSNYLIIS